MTKEEVEERREGEGEMEKQKEDKKEDGECGGGEKGEIKVEKQE